MIRLRIGNGMFYPYHSWLERAGDKVGLGLKLDEDAFAKYTGGGTSVVSAPNTIVGFMQRRALVDKDGGYGLHS